jgi:DNA modification methylase
MELKIEYLPLEALTPYERNARKHEAADIATIKNSIKEFEMCDPIGIWGDKNIIVEGHGRLLALKELGHTQAPCIRLDHLTDEQRRAYALAHNKTAEMSEWDLDLVESEIAALEMDMSQFGFDIDSDDEITVVEDEAPEVDEEAPPVTQLGDIWQLGRHRLLCGDSTDPVNIDLLMNGNKCDMAFTDPPYGYNYQSNMREKTNKFDVIENDDKILDFFPSIKRVCDGFIYICTTWKTADKWIELFKRYYDLTNVIIWDKGGGGIGDLFHTFATDYEMILVCNNGKEIKGKRYGSVWNFTNQEITKMKKEELLNIILEQKKYFSIWHEKKDNPNEYIHPTQKPVSLSARAIRSSTEIGGNVIDLFGGSGSTLIACEQLDRTCYVMELDPKYCDVIVKRWETLTGEKAVRL